MFSSFGALRALLLVAASLCSPVVSVPTSLPSALAQRSFKDYYDNLLYLDSKKSCLYTAISMGSQTYAACMDNKWSGLAVYGDKYSSGGSTHSITIDETQVQVQDGRSYWGMWGAEYEIAYFHAPSWPSELPKLGYKDIGTAYIGMNVNNPNSAPYSYWSYKWPKDYSKWYYDMMVGYEWKDKKSSDVDFAGVIVFGETLSWSNLLGISSSQVSQYGLPSLDGISKQPYIWLRDDGTFYADNCFWVGGKQYNWNSEVPKTPSDKVVVDIRITERWSTFPDEIVKAIYSYVPGNKYYPQSAYGYYQIPCDAKLSFTIVIEGTKYVVTEETLIAANPWGDQCIGSIFTKGQAVSAVPEVDIIIGFQVLSSYYYRAGWSQDSKKPYYKLLPLPTPKGGWDNKQYYTTPSYPYTTWKPTYTTTYGGGSGSYNGGESNGNNYQDNSKGSWQSTSSSYHAPQYTSTYNGGNQNGGNYNGGNYNGGGNNGGNYNSGNAYSSQKYSAPSYTTTSSYYSKPTSYSYSSSSSSYYNGHGNGYSSVKYDTDTTTTTSYYTKPTYYSSSSSASYYNGNGNGHGYSSSSSSYYSKPTYYSSSSYSNGNGYTSSSSVPIDYHPKFETPSYVYTSSSSSYYNNDNKYTSTQVYKPTTTSYYQGSGNGYNNGNGYSYETYHSTAPYQNGGGYNGGGSNGYSSPSYNNGAYSSSAPGYGSGNGNNYGNGYGYAANKVAGNLAEDDSDSNNGTTDWEKTAKLYQTIIIVLASVIGVGFLGAITACVVSRRKSKNAPRPSAYRTIHESESTEPKVPLYGAEGGSSRYGDPYADSTQ